MSMIEGFSERTIDSSFDTPSSLFERARKGDPKAVGTLCQLYAPWLYAKLRGWNIQPQDAADVTQDVLLIISQEIAGLDRDGKSRKFRAWLYVVMRNAVRQVLRRHRIFSEHFGDQLPDWILNEQVSPEHEEEAENSQQAHLLEVLLTTAMPAVQAEVEPETWETFELMVFKGYTEREAAEAAGITPNAARQRKHRVLKRLRQKCQELLGE